MALAVRLAHALGLHREGSKTGLSPFEQELRRRLWWGITTLDIRCAQDLGSDQMILPSTFNTKMPLNINDSDLDPTSTQPPIERQVFTEMTKSRLSHVVFHAGAYIYRSPPVKDEAGATVASVEDKVKAMVRLEKEIEKEILSKCDPSQPVAWTATVVAQLIMRRVRLSVYHPLQHGNQVIDRPKVSRDELLRTAVENLEFAHLLDTEPIAARYRWFFNTFVQWHALAATLAELCIQTEGELVERAWRVVDVVFEDWAERIADSPNGMLWRPIKKLKSKAQATREAGHMNSAPLVNGHQPQLPLPYFGTPAVTNLQTPGIEATSFGFPSTRMPNVSPSMALDPTSYAPDHGMSSAGLNALYVDESGQAINWAEWDEFMNDYHMDMQQANDPKAPLHEIKPPDRWF